MRKVNQLPRHLLHQNDAVDVCSIFLSVTVYNNKYPTFPNNTYRHHILFDQSPDTQIGTRPSEKNITTTSGSAIAAPDEDWQYYLGKELVIIRPITDETHTSTIMLSFSLLCLIPALYFSSKDLYLFSLKTK